MTTITLDPAADILAERGWAQGETEAEDGRVSLTGALKVCNMRPGDWLVARAVLRMAGHTEIWNDVDGRTEAEVMAVLRGRTISDDDLAATFGPRWQPIVALVRRAAVLTVDEAHRLQAAQGAAQYVAQDVARYAAWYAEQDAAWYAAQDAAWYAAWYAVRSAAGYAAQYAAGYAAWALAVADLVGQHGLQQHHIDTLLAPWIEVCGDPRDVR